MYEVGQVLYVLIKKEHSVIPVKVVEKILRKTLEGESVSYIVELPTQEQNHVDLDRLGTSIYSSSADAMSVMIENASTTISDIVKKAENIAKSVFNVTLAQNDAPDHINQPDVNVNVETAGHTIETDYQPAVPFNIGEHIEIDLGQGVKGKVNVSRAET